MEQTALYILEVLGCILITIGIGYGGSKLFEVIIGLLKDGPIKYLLGKINKIFAAAIKQIYQEEVEALKMRDQFTKEKQAEVKAKAANIIRGNLTPRMVKYIEKKHGDLDKYIDNHIEVVIYDLKRK